MNKDSFDKALRQKLPDTATDFDMDAAWEALEARRKRRRIPIWWYVLAGLALTTVAGWWALDQTRPMPAGESNTAQTTGPGGEKADASRQSPVRTDREMPSVGGRATGAFSSPGIPAGLADAGMTIPGVPEGNLHSPFAAPDAIIWPEDYVFPNGLDTAALYAPGPEVSYDGYYAAFRRPRLLVPELLPLTEIDPVESLQPNNIDLGGSRIALAVKKHHRKQHGTWWLGLQAGYGQSAVSRSGSDDHVLLRNQEEETLDLIHAGLQLRRTISGSWFVQTGIRYAQWTDARRLAYEETSTQTVPDLLLRQIVYPDGNVENIYGPGEVTVIRSIEAEQYNRYRWLELPVETGLALPFGKHWQLDITAGLAFGLATAQSGTASIGAATHALEDLPYRKSGTLSATASLEWLYRAPHWAAGIGLQGRTGLNSTTTSGAAFSEKRQAAGLGLVVRRTLR